MKKILKKSLHILCTTLGIIPFMLTSCNYLAVDEYFNDLTPLDSIFARQDYLERYVWGTAALMPAQGNLFSGSYGPYETAVDEVLLSWQKAEYAGTYLYADKITQNDSYYNMWGQYYKGIRKCNTIFTRIDECKDLKGLDRREIMGLTHFMRASFYFYLLELYGPAVILPEEPLSVDENIENLSFERNTYDECVEYICKDLEEAYSLLDPTRPSTQFERPTKYAAAALMSRVRLYQASKWYNGNQYYADWTTSDGRNMIAQQYDPVKWAKSAAASKRIIDSGIYSLYTVPSDENTYASSQASQAEFPLGVGGIDPYHSYIDMFNGEALAVKNPELIYATPLNNNIISIAFPLKLGGWNGLGITQKLIDAYYMKDGEDYVLANIPFAQYVKADFDFAKNFMIDPRNSFVFHIGVGVAYPYGNSKMLPFEKRYFSGGANSVRGWSVRSLGPGVYKGSEDGRMDFINQAGDIKLDLNIEYRTHLFWKLNGAAFVDAGNIWTIRDDSGQEGGLFKFNEFYKQIAVAYGLGIRLDLDYLILRFDGGMKAINPVETGKKRYPVIRPRFSRDFAFHFAVGYPF